MAKTFIGLGTNLGDRAANLAQARAMLAGLLNNPVFSRVYESEPVGYTDQPLFLNQVAAGETGLLPAALLGRLKTIEREMGREATFPGGPRLIDLDLLFYDDWVMAADGLIVPHPRLRERSFVLAPLHELAPEFRDPLTGVTIGGLWTQKADKLAYSYIYNPD